MALGSASLCRLALWLWIGLICFSSSELAGRWADDLCEAVFAGVAGSDLPLDQFLFQKSAHVFLFSVLGILTTIPPGARSISACLAICVAVAIGAEALQLFAPHRTPAWSDVGLNLAASLAACGISLRRQGRAVFS